MRRLAFGVSLLLFACFPAAGRGATTPDSAATRDADDSTSRRPWSDVRPPGPSHWFYEGLPYGSDALVHPLRLVFNGTFGTLQFDNRSNRLDDVSFRHGWS